MNYNTLKNIKFGIYVRKSQEDKNRQVQSIASQIDVLTECAEKEGIDIVQVYKDCGSAHKPNNREQFNQMLQDINDKKIEGVLCWKADGLARNHIEGGMIMHCLEQNIIRVIKTPYKVFYPSDNNLPLTIEFGMANQYSRDLSLNIKRGNKTKVKNGGWCHVAPQGYINDKLTKTVRIDPERFQLIQRMWELMLEGEYSILQICKIANEKWGYKTPRKGSKGGVSITSGTLHSIFNNPFYYGYIKTGENYNWGNHKPMISFDEFIKVQEILKKNGRKAHTNQTFAYSGLIRCGKCSARITAEVKVKYKCPKCNKKQTAKNPKKCACGYMIKIADIKRGKYYTYYHCSNTKNKCSKKYIRKEALSTQFENLIDSIIVNDSFIKWAKRWLKSLKEYRDKEREKYIKNEQIKLRKFKLQRTRLVEMRIDNEIDANLFKEKKKVIDNQIFIIENKKYDLKSVFDEVTNDLDFLKKLKIEFLKDDNKNKKTLLLKLLSNPLLTDEKLDAKAKKKYLALLNLRVYEIDGVEPPKDYSINRLKGNLKDCHSMWCRTLNEKGTF